MIKKISSKVNISQNLKNTIKISFGTVSGQLISIITLPIFTRIYGTEIIGIWALFNSIATIVNSFSDLGMSNSLMIENDEEMMLTTYKVITSIVIIISIISAVALLFYYSFIDKSINLNPIFISIFMLIAIFTLQQTQICYTWLNKKGKYNLLMKNPLINNGAFGIVAIILGILGFKEYGYYIGWIMGQVITLIHMRRVLPKKFITLKYSDYKYVLTKNREYIRYQLPANILANVKNQLPVLLIKGMFGSSILGFYSVSVKLLNVPISFLAKSMGRIYFKNVSDIKDNVEKIGKFTFSNLSKAMKFSIVPMIALIGFGDIITQILLGVGNEEAGIIIRIVAVQYIFLFLSMTVHGLPIILGKQKYVVILCVVQIAVYLFSFSIGKYVFDNIYISLMLMSILSSIVNIIYFSKLFIHMKMSWKKYVIDIMICLCIIFFGSIILRYIANYFLR